MIKEVVLNPITIILLVHLAFAFVFQIANHFLHGGAIPLFKDKHVIGKSIIWSAFVFFWVLPTWIESPLLMIVHAVLLYRLILFATNFVEYYFFGRD